MTANILHLSHPIFNPTAGGTEIFIDRLILELKFLGLESSWAFHSPGQGASNSISYLKSLPSLSVDQVYNYNHSVIPRFFGRLLEELSPSLLHVHGISAQAGLAHVRIACEFNIPIVLTLHSPSDICHQGMLLEFGNISCDGMATKQRCTVCHLQRSGFPSFASHLAGSFLSASGSLVVPSSRWSRALKIKLLHESYIQVVEEIISRVFCVHVLSEWYLKIMIERFPAYAHKFKLVRSASPLNMSDPGFAPKPKGLLPESNTRLCLGYIGRFAHTKGLEMILEAISLTHFSHPIDFIFYGFDPDDDYSRSLYSLLLRYGLESIVRFERFVERTILPSILTGRDLLLIPSQWQEVGPLIMYEALSLGVPVAATDLGGPAEILPLVENSFLLPYDVNAWSCFLASVGNHDIKLSKSIFYSRSFKDLAAELKDSVYAPLISF